MPTQSIRGATDNQENICTEACCCESQAIQFTLIKISTGDKDYLLAAALRCQGQKTTAGKQQGKYLSRLADKQKNYTTRQF